MSLRLDLVCVGRLGGRPEGSLAVDWAQRATQAGRAHGLGPVRIVEVDARRAGKAGEAEALLPRLEDAHVIACDERGQTLGSRAFAAVLADLRDSGISRAALVVGGADGLDPGLLARADMRLAFGPQTWPHALARAMLAEQVYRAATILAGTPYHRD